MASRIHAGLYQGNHRDVEHALRDGNGPSFYEVIVLCAEEFQPPSNMFKSRVEILHAGFDDCSMTLEILDKALPASKLVAQLLRQGKDVLVTCWAGRNRSGLVSALALRELLDCDGQTAVNLVKAKRENALTNESFVKFLSFMPRPSVVETLPNTSGGALTLPVPAP